jgi:hypothetical protein
MHIAYKSVCILFEKSGGGGDKKASLSKIPAAGTEEIFYLTSLSYIVLHSSHLIQWTTWRASPTRPCGSYHLSIPIW